MTILWIQTLERLVPLVEQKLAESSAEAGAFSHAEYDGWRQRLNAAEAKLIAFLSEQEGARFSHKPASEHSVKMAGLRASSTGGTTAALQNWCTAARKQIAKADGFNPHGSGPVLIEARETKSDHHCPICQRQFEPVDSCATDIELGICHAACLEGSPTVDLDTGNPVDGPIGTYRFDEAEGA